MRILEIEYEGLPLATVEVDEDKANPIIREMVGFWMGWEDALAMNGGDYLKTWLKKLGMFILRNHRPPNDDEGWVNMDGKHGIKLKDWTPWEPDEDAISIERT